jgi:hypothetical protein
LISYRLASKQPVRNGGRRLRLMNVDVAFASADL